MEFKKKLSLTQRILDLLLKSKPLTSYQIFDLINYPQKNIRNIRTTLSLLYSERKIFRRKRKKKREYYFYVKQSEFDISFKDYDVSDEEETNDLSYILDELSDSD